MSHGLTTRRSITIGQRLLSYREGPQSGLNRFLILAQHDTNVLRFCWRYCSDNSSWSQARYSLSRFQIQRGNEALRTMNPLRSAQRPRSNICIVRLPNSLGSRPQNLR